MCIVNETEDITRGNGEAMEETLKKLEKGGNIKSCR